MAEGSAATTSSSIDDASSASAAAAAGSSMNGDASPRSRGFRQRSMINASQLNGNEEVLPAVSMSPFDVEGDGGGGMRVSQSMAKLEMLEHQHQHQLVVRGSVDPVVVMKTIFYVLVWYTFSTCLTLYNKTLLGDKLGKFPAPLLMNTFHFTLQAVLSKIIVFIQSRKDNSNLIMSWKDYFIRVVPTALGTALDINLSNASLVFISVTFATMCKSASPIFLLLFAFAFRLESPSVKLLGIILIISMGVLLTVAKETEFEFWGFIFVMMAAVMSGFRWSMTQILLQNLNKEVQQRSSTDFVFFVLFVKLRIIVLGVKLDLKKEAYGLRDPITLMSYVTPVMAVATFIGSLLMDPWDKFDTNIYFNNPWHVARSCLLMLIGGTLAFFMVLIEYVLVSVTSAITVTIAGVVKEAVTIVVAVLYFHDKFTLLKGVGLVTIMVGVSLFNWYKYEKLKKGHSGESEETIPLSSNGDPKYVIIDEFESLDSELES